MPYVDKKLKKEYQKRTATPYMKEWRERNRERHRAYMREWARKRRQNKDVVKRDYQVAKIRPAYKKNAAMTTEKLKLMSAGMHDNYILYCLTKRGVIAKEIVNTQLIEIHRRMLIIKRKLKEYDNDSN